MAWVIDKGNNVVIPGDNQSRIAKVVEIDPSIMVDEGGSLIPWNDKRAVGMWIKKRFQGQEGTIADDGSLQLFTGKNLNDSQKGSGHQHVMAYAGLDHLICHCVYDRSRPPDPHHMPRITGQKIYYAAMKAGENLYSVKLVLDGFKDSRALPTYKGHNISKIEIDNGSSPVNGQIPWNADLSTLPISGISLAVLKGEVNPSWIHKGVLHQHDPITGAISGATAFIPDGPTIVRICRAYDKPGCSSYFIKGDVFMAMNCQ